MEPEGGSFVGKVPVNRSIVGTLAAFLGTRSCGWRPGLNQISFWRCGLSNRRRGMAGGGTDQLDGGSKGGIFDLCCNSDGLLLDQILATSWTSNSGALVEWVSSDARKRWHVGVWPKALVMDSASEKQVEAEEGWSSEGGGSSKASPVRVDCSGVVEGLPPFLLSSSSSRPGLRPLLDSPVLCA